MVVVGFVVASLAVPLSFRELYPFSIAPMFSDAPQCYYEYAVFDPQGRPLPLANFALQRNYWGNPPDLGHGIQPPETLDRFNHPPDPEELTRHVARRLESFPELDYVVVVVERISALDAHRVGVVERHEWRIPNSNAPTLKRPPS
jgi:hypothetical protein